MVDLGLCEKCKKEMGAGEQRGFVDSAGMTHSFCPKCYPEALKKEFGQSNKIIEREDKPW